MDPSSESAAAAPVTAPAPAPQPTWSDSFSQADTYAEQLRVKLPLAPPGLVNGYMTVVPWIAIVFGIIGILLGLGALVASTIIAPFLFLLGLGGGGFGLVFGVLIFLVSCAIEVAGGWMMLQRRTTGWWLLAVGIVISVLSSLVHISVIGLIFWLLIAYIHLQVKPNYVN